ncbi:MAG: chlorophyllase/cutinase-like alpha/beta fold protein [bacterium]
MSSGEESTINVPFINPFGKTAASQVFFFSLLIIFMAVSPAQSCFPPGQPAKGPGGSDYSYNAIICNLYGSGAQGYYLFEPVVESDEQRPESLPVIVFVHGLLLTNPDIYGGWINHIVRKGNIVIFPIYQTLFTPYGHFVTNVMASIKAALEELHRDDHIRPDTTKFALVGHSCGGVLVVNVAALAGSAGLPLPDAIMAVAPGLSSAIGFENLREIDSGTLLLATAGDADFMTRDVDARAIYQGTTNIHPDNKDLVIFRSDYHGFPFLVAGHFAPCGSTSDCGLCIGIDALDYYGYWKLFEALTDAAFDKINREYALGNTDEQRDMGDWSDGTCVNELIVLDLDAEP